MRVHTRGRVDLCVFENAHKSGEKFRKRTKANATVIFLAFLFRSKSRPIF